MTQLDFNLNVCLNNMFFLHLCWPGGRTSVCWYASSPAKLPTPIAELRTPASTPPSHVVQLCDDIYWMAHVGGFRSITVMTYIRYPLTLYSTRRTWLMQMATNEVTIQGFRPIKRYHVVTIIILYIHHFGQKYDAMLCEEINGCTDLHT